MMTYFWRMALLAFVLLLFLYACTTEKPETFVKNETVDGAVGEEETVKEIDTAFSVTQLDQEANISIERFGWRGFEISESWKGFEISENCRVDNNSLTQIDFPDTSVCELGNFKLFFDSFSENNVFQLSTTKFPVKLTTIIPPWDPLWDPDSILIEIECLDLPKNSSVRPLFPTKEERDRENLYFSHTLEGSVAIVRLGIEDTGFLMEYIFIWDMCWALSEIKDFST